MKKSSLIKKANSRQTFQTKRIFLWIITGVICVGLYFVVPVFVRGSVNIIWYPVDMTRIWLNESASSLPQYIRDRGDLINELEALKIKVATEQGTENTIKKLQNENTELRTFVGALSESRILGRVIGRPGTLPYDVLMLDRGRVNGVVENAPVFLGSDQVIGFISKVNEKTSLVTLVTTAGFSSSAYVVGPNIFTFAEGVGGGVLRVRIPQGIALSTGDLVLLPVIDSGVYGSITYIETSATQPEQYGYVTSNIPLQSLYYVSIGREGIIPNTFPQAETLVADIKSTLFTVDVPIGVLVTPETQVSSSTLGTSTRATTTNHLSI